MSQAQHASQKGGKPAPAGPASSARALTSTQAQRTPAFALGQGAAPALPLFGGGGDLQTKLAVGQPDDPSEREADATADSVADDSQTLSRLATDATARDETPEPEKEEEEKKVTQEGAQTALLRDAAEKLEETGAEAADVEKHLEGDEATAPPKLEALRRTADPDEGKREKHERLAPARPAADTADPPKAALPHIPKQGGRPLPPADRLPFEQTFGHRFEHVKVHTTPSADSAARQLGAGAFTVGHDIYFRSDSYAPGTPQGDRVLAHELTHVVQHDQGRVPRPSHPGDSVSRPSDPLEVEAYSREGSAAQGAGTLRGGTPPPAPPPAPASAPAPSAAPSVTLRDEAGPARTDAGPGPEAGGPPAGPSDDQLIPPPPERPTPLEENAGAPPAEPPPVEEMAAAQPAPAPPEAAPQPEGEGAAPAAQPQPSAGGQAPQLEPPEPQTEWVTGPLDLGVAPVEPEPEAEAPAAEAPTEGAAATAGGDAAEARASALEAETESLTQRLSDSGTASSEAIQSRIAELTDAARAEAESARARVAAAYEEQRAAVSAALEATLSGINQTRDQQLEAVTAFADSERERLRAAKRTQEDAATALAEELRTGTLAAGEAEAQRALAGSEERAQTILSEAAAVGAGGEPASVEAQREAATRIAEDTAEKCRSTGEDLASGVREEAELHAEKYDELLQEFLEKLEESLTDAESSIDQFSDHATGLVNSRAEQALAGAQEMASQSDAALESQAEAADEQIGAWEEQATTTLSEAGSQLTGRLAEQVESLRATFAGFGVQASASLRSMAGSSPDEVETASTELHGSLREGYDSAAAAFAEFDANTATQLDATFEELRANLTATADERTSAAAAAGAQMAQMLRDAGAAATAALDEAVAAYRTQLSGGVDGAVEELNNGGADYRSQSQQVQAEGLSKLAQLVSDGLASEDTLVSDARAEMGTAVAEIATQYETQKAAAEREAAAAGEVPATRIHRGLWGDFWDAVGSGIDRIRRAFANFFGEWLGGFIFGILAALVMVAIGLLIGWVVGLILAALKVAAIVGVILLLVVAVGLNIYNRFQEFYADHPGEDAGFWRGLGLVGLGIADLTGIPFIVEGLVGTRAFSPHPMSPFEKGERLGMGLIFFGAAIVSLRGILRPRSKPPIKPVPDPQTGQIGKLPPPSPTRPMADVMKWGDGINGIPKTRARTRALTRQELVDGGVSRQLAEQWRDFYVNESARNPFDPATGRGNPQAAPRAELMQRAVDLLAGPPGVTPIPVQPPQGGDDDEGGE
jgi:hypothetical protein